MTSIFKKTLVTAVTAAVLAASLAATPASAANGRNAAFFGGLVGGLAIGALAAGAYQGGYYDPGYGGDCYFDRRPVYNHWGDMVGYRRVRVCN